MNACKRPVTLAMDLTAFSPLMAAILVMSLFLAALLKFELGLIVACFFVAGMGPLLVFPRDVRRTLGTLKLDIERRE